MWGKKKNDKWTPEQGKGRYTWKPIILYLLLLGPLVQHISCKVKVLRQWSLTAIDGFKVSKSQRRLKLVISVKVPASCLGEPDESEPLVEGKNPHVSQRDLLVDTDVEVPHSLWGEKGGEC